MRRRGSKHWKRAGRVLLVGQRQDGQDGDEDDPDTSDAQAEPTDVDAPDDSSSSPPTIIIDGGEFTLTGPITFTITRSIPDFTSSSTSISSSSALPSIIPTLSSSSSSTVQTESSPTSTSTSSSSSDPGTLSSTTFQTTSTPTMSPKPSSDSGSQSGNDATQMGALQSSNKSLPAGTIVGIVVACLFILIGASIFLYRQISRAQRKRDTGLWATPGQRNSVGNIPNTTTFNPRSSQAGVIAPPLSYNPNGNPGNAEGVAPLYAAPLAAYRGPSVATVTSTFVPDLADEIPVRHGEQLRVLAQYDDGWALCTRLDGSGEQGMVPLECLDWGRRMTTPAGGIDDSSGASQQTSPPGTRRASRRMSSLPPKRAG